MFSRHLLQKIKGTVHVADSEDQLVRCETCDIGLSTDIFLRGSPENRFLVVLANQQLSVKRTQVSCLLVRPVTNPTQAVIREFVHKTNARTIGRVAGAQLVELSSTWR